MTNIINIIKATNGKNIVVSSRADGPAMHRSVYDVGAVMLCLGMGRAGVLEAMRGNCEGVVRSGQHRMFMKGAVKEISSSVGVKLNRRIRKHRDGLRKIREKI